MRSYKVKERGGRKKNQSKEINNCKLIRKPSAAMRLKS